MRSATIGRKTILFIVVSTIDRGNGGYYASYDNEMTATREALIEKLVVSLHLSVPERQLAASDSVSVEEVAAVVKRLLNRMAGSHLLHGCGNPEKSLSTDAFS